MSKELISSFETKKKRKRVELNITPFVDVMLVLVTMLMAVSQASVGNIDVDLPTSSSVAESDVQMSDPIIITVSKDLDVYIADELIEIEFLIEKLTAISQQNKDLRIYVKGDKLALYDNIINIISLINKAGFHKVSLVTSLADNGSGQSIRNSKNPSTKQHLGKTSVNTNSSNNAKVGSTSSSNNKD